MGYFIWANYLNTGNTMIDNDHRQLVGMINALNDAAAAGKGQYVMNKVLNNLITYCKVHFEREEDLMRRNAYPKYQEHKNEHDKFIAEIDRLKNDFDKGMTINSTYIVKILSDWLRNHIVKVDTQLANSIQGTTN